MKKYFKLGYLIFLSAFFFWQVSAKVNAEESIGKVSSNLAQNQEIRNEETAPAFYSFTLSGDKGYEFNNTTGQDITLEVQSSNTYYDYIDYNADGKITNQYKRDWGRLKVLKNHKVRISSASGLGVTFSIAYEYKDKVKESTPAYYKVESTETKGYEIDNSEGKTYKILSNG